MKKLLFLFTIISISLASCGREGPPGIPGRDGLDGLNGTEGFTFEYEFSFTAPDYAMLLNLPDDFVMLDSDVMLVYFLWEVEEDGTEIWRQIPQTLYFTDGLLEYNFDFTKFDANVFLDGTVNLDGLGAIYTDNWIARIVVIPAQFAGRTAIDYSNYDEVKAHFNLSNSSLVTREYAKRPE